MDSGSRDPAGSDSAIRRSGRSRTASSMYAKSIDEFKKVEVGRWQSLRKPGRSLRFVEEDSGAASVPQEDSCSMDLEENAIACRLPEGDSHRLIWVTVIGPQRPSRPNRAPEPRSSNTLKKKSSAFKEPPKEAEKKQSYLLDILLGAAIKVAHGPQDEEAPESEPGEQDESQQHLVPQKPSETSNGQPKKQEGRQRSKLAERDEDLKKLGRMQAKFAGQSARFQQIKNKLTTIT